MWAMMHAKQSYLNSDYSVVKQFNEDMPLYHIFKLIKLLILACFLLSFGTDYIGWKHQA